METFSALLAICVGNSPVTGEFPTQRPVTRSFDVFFDLRLNKRLSKQSWGWWLETLSRPLRRHRNAMAPFINMDYLSSPKLIMDMWSHVQQNAGWNYLSIPKLQRCIRWSLGMGTLSYPTLSNGFNYLSMLGSRLNHVSKRRQSCLELYCCDHLNHKHRFSMFCIFNIYERHSLPIASTLWCSFCQNKDEN